MCTDMFILKILLLNGVKRKGKNTPLKKIFINFKTPLKSYFNKIAKTIDKLSLYPPFLYHPKNIFESDLLKLVKNQRF